MWKYRGEIIFATAILFAARAVIQPNVVHMLGSLIFISAHYLDRFFDTARAESKLIAKVASYEQEVADLKVLVGRVSLTMGIRKPQ